MKLSMDRLNCQAQLELLFQRSRCVLGKRLLKNSSCYWVSNCHLVAVIILFEKVELTLPELRPLYNTQIVLGKQIILSNGVRNRIG